MISFATSGAAATLYYSTATTPATSADWSTTYTSSAKWIAVYIAGGAGSVELPSAPTPLRVRADLSAQIRVRPSSTLVAEVEQIVGPGAVSLR